MENFKDLYLLLILKLVKSSFRFFLLDLFLGMILLTKLDTFLLLLSLFRSFILIFFSFKLFILRDLSL